MCFNASVSLFTYLFGSIGSVILYNFSNLKPEAVFYLWVCLMQLIEFFLWKSQNCNNTPILSNPTATQRNLLFTKLGIFINHFEPIVYWLAILYFSYTSLPSYVNYLMILFVIFTLFYLKNILTHQQCTTVTKESYPHLFWEWNQGPYASLYYIYFLIMLVLLAQHNSIYGSYHSSLIVISFILSYLIYKDTHTVGAMWCFAASFAPWALWINYT
jgi:hypothetical protein